jgi:large subunit ribosomal protein L20
MRIKRGVTKKQKHQKTLKQAKGYRLTYSKLYKRAKEALLHAGEYNYAHRKKRQNEYRKVWIKMINAVCKRNSTSYSRFMKALKDANVQLDRKVLAYLAYNYEPAFEKFVQDITAK